jgi:exodeoxyribonuclease VII small subunit
MSQTRSYKQLNQELEAVLDRLQSSDLDVDQIINEYQKGIDIVEELEKYVKSAQNKITKINQKSTKSKK